MTSPSVNPEIPVPPKRRKSSARGLTTASIVSFSLTLLAASIAVLTGMVPLHSLPHVDRLDIGELLFLMPVVALVLGVVFEAARIAFTRVDLPEPRQRRAIRGARSRNER